MNNKIMNNIKGQIKPSSTLIENTSKKMKKSLGNSENRKSEIRMKNNFKYVKLIIVAVAVLFVCIINISPTVAMVMKEIPIVGSFIKVISISTYRSSDEDKTVIIDKPKVVEVTKEYLKSDLAETTVDINQEIELEILEYTREADQRIAEYKKAFIETGGTEQGFEEKQIQVVVNHEIKGETEEYFSFALSMYEDWNSAYAVTRYFNLDAKTGSEIQLIDLLGDNYIDIANKEITNQIAESDKVNKNSLYFSQDIGCFTTINEESNFYINQSGNPVIVFDKYEISPGSTGRPEFEIINE